MLKPTLIAAALGLALSLPAAAQTTVLTCDDATIAAMEHDMYRMADPKAKQSAMEDLIIAKSALKNNNIDECLQRMAKAAETMRKT